MKNILLIVSIYLLGAGVGLAMDNSLRSLYGSNAMEKGLASAGKLDYGPYEECMDKIGESFPKDCDDYFSGKGLNIYDLPK